jgi:hypothetical protein
MAAQQARQSRQSAPRSGSTAKKRANTDGATAGRSQPAARRRKEPSSDAAISKAAAKVIRDEEASGNSIGEQEEPFHRPKWHRAYSFGLLTGAFFLLSWAGQFVFQMINERNEAAEHGQEFAWSEFFPQFFSSTFENWQSEFLQLVWQAAGLALFYFWGSSQSKEGDERLEAKIDLLLRDRGIDASKL